MWVRFTESYLELFMDMFLLRTEGCFGDIFDNRSGLFDTHGSFDELIIGDFRNLGKG